MTKKAWDDESASQGKSDYKTLTPDASKLLVKVIEDNNNGLAITFGITDEDDKRIQVRLQELLYEEKKNKHCSLAKVLVDISKECVHANQLAYAAFALGRITAPGDKNSRSSIGGIIMKKDGKLTRLDGNEPLPDFLKDILRDILGSEGDKDF